MKFYKTAILTLVATVLMAGQASADHGYGLAIAGLYGYGGFNHFGIRPYVPAPPYFSIHPPVYYGARYARPYGDSPFAALPQLHPAKGYSAKPYANYAITIENPYCPATPVSVPGVSPVVQNKKVEPLVIDNPYFRPDRVQLTNIQ
jgi:hypothetical protein